MRKIKNISDVVNGHLCSGCGVCSYLAPDKIKMIDVLDSGKRPILSSKVFAEELPSDVLDCCPGWKIERSEKNIDDKDCIQELKQSWGDIYEIWEGYASDQQVRQSGSSGGILTAISQYCLEYENMSHVLNTAADEQKPYLNETRCTTNKKQLLNATGSRYSPSSPCEKLQNIEDADSSCVFIGKPCDAYATQKARKTRPELDKNIGVVLSFFCAGVPSTGGTLKLVKKMGVKSKEDIQSLRYRGNGWPGMWTLKYKEKSELKQKQLTYGESWGELQKDRQWRCYICPDHVGEFSDISVGDPWYKEIKEGDLGRSLIIVRTKLGQDIMRKAEKEGYIDIERCNPDVLSLSQPNLIQAKNVLWGRLFALKISRSFVPLFKGFSLFYYWNNELSANEKIKSIIGTLKRVYIKKLYSKKNMDVLNNNE